MYSDANDKWVRSRTIWSQHAYHVTHIEEDGTVPQTSLWDKNWLQPELNNFRQNVPGNSNGSAIPDATAGASDFDSCDGGDAILTVDICNRGAAPQGAGIVIGFYVGADQVCQTTTMTALDPEECEQVTCLWTSPPTNQNTAVDVTVIANDGQGASECHDGNNVGNHMATGQFIHGRHMRKTSSTDFQSIRLVDFFHCLESFTVDNTRLQFRCKFSLFSNSVNCSYRRH